MSTIPTHLKPRVRQLPNGNWQFAGSGARVISRWPPAGLSAWLTVCWPPAYRAFRAANQDHTPYRNV